MLVLWRRALENQEYIKDTALDFCRKQNLKSAMIKSIGLLQSSSFDEIAIVINDSSSWALITTQAMIGKKISKRGLSPGSGIPLLRAGLS